ncbi:hypothetical protein T440DRAFT_182358 [Plenodomus tracheiphilus IPT5]|uniref:Uncharacterized protein n=1 Tax=Plenodomus tracheiphilus IPT5 TaxID=1408161 RepID=A0A6A7AXL2_9PLEO|nr:hypothetical protein T440DRAFT_182358 [Plenodomus tracheiphilus IPT5]
MRPLGLHPHPHGFVSFHSHSGSRALICRSPCQYFPLRQLCCVVLEAFGNAEFKHPLPPHALSTTASCYDRDRSSSIQVGSSRLLPTHLYHAWTIDMCRNMTGPCRGFSNNYCTDHSPPSVSAKTLLTKQSICCVCQHTRVIGVLRTSTGDL